MSRVNFAMFNPKEFFKDKTQVILAPMAGVCDKPFRSMVRKFGDNLLYSEMLASNSMVQSHVQTIKMAEDCSGEKPIVMQISGSNSEVLSKAAQIVESKGADGVDINMGCPVKKLIKNNCGVALMRDPKLVGQIISSVVNVVKIPVSVKFRAGWNDNINAVEIAKIAEDNGASYVTIHGRTQEQMYSGVANLDIIKQVKDSVTIPVVGNGDICDGPSAVNMLEKTGVDAVMVGRAVCGAPWLLAQISNYIKNTDAKKDIAMTERYNLLMEHYDRIISYYGEESGLKVARKHVCWYVKGLYEATDFKNKFNLIKDINLAKKEIEYLFNKNYEIK